MRTFSRRVGIPSKTAIKCARKNRWQYPDNEILLILRIKPSRRRLALRELFSVSGSALANNIRENWHKDSNTCCAETLVERNICTVEILKEIFYNISTRIRAGNPEIFSCAPLPRSFYAPCLSPFSIIHAIATKDRLPPRTVEEYYLFSDYEMARWSGTVLERRTQPSERTYLSELAGEYIFPGGRIKIARNCAQWQCFSNVYIITEGLPC